MECPSETEAVGRTVRLTGFENEEYTHRCPLFPRVRTLLVAGSRVRPAVLGGCLACRPVMVSPRTRSDYFGIRVDVVVPLRISRGRAVGTAPAPSRRMNVVIPAQAVAKQAIYFASTRRVYKICEISKSA
jgi:hypothetical protein